MTSFSDMVFGAGMPLLTPGVSIPSVNGKVWFVNGSAAGTGISPAEPFPAIQNAYDSARPGDTIFVFPGEYDENLVITKDYITIMGANLSGYGKPDLVASAGVTLKVEAQGFIARNLRLSSADSDVVQQNGNGFEYTGCVFDGDGQGATEALLRLVGLAADDGYTASEGLIQGNLFRGNAAGYGLAFQHAANPSGVGTTDNRVIGNRFVGNAVDLQSLVNVSGGGAGIFLNTLIAANYFMTVGAAFVYADMDQGAAGDLAANSALICGNFFADAALIAAQFDISGQPNVIFTGNYDAAGLVNGAAFNS